MLARSALPTESDEGTSEGHSRSYSVRRPSAGGGEVPGRLGHPCLTGGASSADREAALWEMEEHHLQERHQLVKQQLKDQYFLQRHELVRKHEKVRLLARRGVGLPRGDLAEL